MDMSVRAACARSVIMLNCAAGGLPAAFFFAPRLAAGLLHIFGPAVLERHDPVKYVRFAQVAAVVAVAHELKPIVQRSVGKGGLELAARVLDQRVGVEVVEIILVFGNVVYIGNGKQLVVRPDFAVKRVRRAQPVDGAAHLASVGRHVVAGLQIAAAAQLGHVPVRVLDNLVAGHEIRAHQPYLAAGL